MKKSTYIEMDYGEFEELVKKHFKVSEFEFPCDWECSNDTCHTFPVRKGEIISKWDMDKLDRWKMTEGKEGIFMSYILLAVLCNDGVIEEGDYLIKVSW